MTINCGDFTLYIQKLGLSATKIGLLAPKLTLGDPVPTCGPLYYMNVVYIASFHPKSSDASNCNFSDVAPKSC